MAHHPLVVRGPRVQQRALRRGKRPLIAWEDATMGLAAQVVNLNDNTLQVAIKHEGNVVVWKATITAFE